MKYSFLFILLSMVFLLSSCAMFYDKQPESTTGVHSPKPLAVPVGKNWQVVEEPPKLSDDSGRLPFQKEESLLPTGKLKPVAPSDDIKIETQR